MANMLMLCRSQWPRSLRYGSADARLLVKRVRIQYATICVTERFNLTFRSIARVVSVFLLACARLTSSEVGAVRVFCI